MIQKFSHSLRIKITLIILLIISLLLLSIGILNNFGLRWFYQNEKVSEIKEAYLKIDNEVMKIGSSGQRIIDESTDDSVIHDSLKSIIIDYSNQYHMDIKSYAR